MYSREKRMKAIELYIKYDKCIVDVIRELGYPSRKLLPQWYKVCLKEQETGIICKLNKSSGKYSQEQKEIAVDHFLKYGHNVARTVRLLGYPSRDTLRDWCEELSPWTRKKCKVGIQYTKQQKEEAVIVLCTRSGSAEDIADKYDVSRAALYKWKNNLLGKEDIITVRKKNDNPIKVDKESLLSEIEVLEQQVKKLKMEKAVLEGAAELIKKDPGVNLKSMMNKEKASLIDALRNEYPLKDLLECLGIVRSSYFYHRNSALNPDKYESLRGCIISLFEENNRSYGYRRIHSELLKKDIHLSEKVVRQIMADSELVAVGKRKRRYSSYQGEDYPSAENLIERDFHAAAPNEKWLTDITEFHIPAGKIYLSPIVDCFDGLLPSWTIGARPDAELVNSMLDGAITTLSPGEHPIIHSDRGFHYRWPGWITRMNENGLTRSMSRIGCSPDNAACEGLFGRIKNEMFYGRSWTDVSIEEFMDILNEYLNWYNEKRIKMSLGAMSPMEYRRSLGLAS